ncbi:MAG: response regulator, partial [Firmicutes bacterium]|nr:response regulator [Bacillota bacterium]
MSKSEAKGRLPMESIRILVIDDEEAIGNVIKDYLEAQGYEVFWAKDGYSALDTFRKVHPDLIILDLMLPGKSGFDVCKELRQESDVPVIMLTAKTDEIDRVLG